MKKPIIVSLLISMIFIHVNAETFQFGRNGYVSITPPEGWEIWSIEDSKGFGYHTITLVADKSRKPGATLNIIESLRLPKQSEKSFLTYIEKFYKESAIANNYIEKTPSFTKLNINNGFAYYVVATYAAYVGKPPAAGRAKICVLVYLYSENNPIVIGELYIDDPDDPAIDIMINSILAMNLSFPDYQHSISLGKNCIFKMDNLDIWQIRVNGTHTESGSGFTAKFTTSENERIMCLITILAAAQPKVMTKEQLLSSLREESDRYAKDSVEERAIIIPIDVKNGYGGYFILTDINLLDKTPGPDEYKMFTRFIIQYDNNAIAVITVLMDDTDSYEYKNIFESIMNMELVLF